MPRSPITLAALLLCSSSASYAADPPRPTTSSAPPATQPAGKPFQPGVWIDWNDRSVVVAARVVLRQGLLEFLACRPGKEHESILRLEATATHVFQALGLVGLEPGHPHVWNDETQEYGPPAGDLVEIQLEWAENGQPRRAHAFEWLRDVSSGRPPVPRPLVFTGSLPIPGGPLAADRSGAAIALVDFPESLLNPTQRRSSRTDELWCAANTPVIPPLGTQVRLRLRAAAPRTYDVLLDFRGELWLAGRLLPPAEVADLVRIARRLDPSYTQIIHVRDALPADVERARHALQDAGLDDAAVRFEQRT